MKLYGQKLAEDIQKRIEDTYKIIDNRNERINNWETDEDDCFLSQRTDEQAISNYRKQLDILKTDGFMDYQIYVDKNNVEHSIGYFRNKFGRYSYVTTIDNQKIYANSEAALMKKTGLIIKKVKVPCWTKFCSNGSGLYGVYTGSYEICRWHTNMVTGEYFGFDKYIEIK